MADEVRIRIAQDTDLIPARAEARALADRLGFTRTDATLIATAISEIARNIVVHVGEGEIVLRALDDGRRCGVLVIACDQGPGIRDVEAAVQQGYADSASLGLGLPGARRLMDEFDLASSPETGTTVTMVKWRIRDDLEMLRERRARR
jgi:anti-sigma regulatory factor (Ser/Thr protein kinase)